MHRRRPGERLGDAPDRPARQSLRRRPPPRRDRRRQPAPGTGKTLLSRASHRQDPGRRRAAPDLSWCATTSWRRKLCASSCALAFERTSSTTSGPASRSRRPSSKNMLSPLNELPHPWASRPRSSGPEHRPLRWITSESNLTDRPPPTITRGASRSDDSSRATRRPPGVHGQPPRLCHRTPPRHPGRAGRDGAPLGAARPSSQAADDKPLRPVGGDRSAACSTPTAWASSFLANAEEAEAAMDQGLVDTRHAGRARRRQESRPNCTARGPAPRHGKLAQGPPGRWTALSLTETQVLRDKLLDSSIKGRATVIKSVRERHKVNRKV